MNIVYEFTNLKIKVAPTLNGHENVVTRVHYAYRALDIDSNAFADYESFHNFELSENTQFNPFESLTQNIVKEWLEAKVDTNVLQPGLIRGVEDKLLSKYVSIKAPWEIEPDVTLEVAPVTET